MTCHLLAVCFDANRPAHLARFWAGVLGGEMADDPEAGIALLPGDDIGFRIRFRPTREHKISQNLWGSRTRPRVLAWASMRPARTR
jgi:Glyoxalase-like domain